MTITRSGMTPKAIKELVNRRVEEVLAAYEATLAANALEAESQSQNGSDGDNGNGGNGNPNENNRGARLVAQECTYQDFMKCQPLNFKETEGFVGLIRWSEKMETVFHISNCPEKYQVKYATCTLLNSALTWWNSHKRTVGTEAAFVMSWRELMKLMAEVYCPRNEIQKLNPWSLWVMAAMVISISSDVSVESVRSSFLRVILIGSNSVKVPVAPEVGAAVVASPVGVLELDTHSSSESDTKIPKRHVSPTNSTLKILTAPILPAPSAVVAPSSEALTARKSVRPLPSHRLALRYTSHHLDRFTSGSSSGHSSSDHSSFGHSISGHSLPRHSPPDTTVADSSTPPRFVHPPLARTPWCSEAYLRWRSALLSTMCPPTIFKSSAGDSSSESSAGPSRKRCRSPAATMSSSIHATRALVPSHIEADATADKVAVDRDVKAGVDAGIGMEVDVGVDVEDGVEDEVESSDKGTIEVGVDVVAGIDIPDGMLMPDVVERLEQDIETGQRELEARSLIDGGERASLLEQVASLEKSNARLRGTMMMERARADRFWRRMSFMESELRQIRRFHYYDRMRFRRLETFAARHLGFLP
ncbi:hypothetical protein Tco_1406489 [Tanacetum coccineum]